MSFQDEWASLKAEAAASRQDSARVTLASAEDEGGGKDGDGKKLRVTPGILRERAGKADTVRHDFATADDTAMSELRSAKKGLDGFDSAAAIDTFTERWQSQMNYLKGVLEHGVAGQLRTAAQSFKSEDLAQAAKNKPKVGDKK